MESEATEEKIDVYIDGASRGNPGPAGVGVVIFDREGNVVDERSRFLGDRTNNQAEYEALILALTKVREIGSSQVKIHSDSELLVKQMRGEFRIRNEGLKALVRKATDLLDSIPDVEIVHIPREENRRADQLANFSIDRNS